MRMKMRMKMRMRMRMRMKNGKTLLERMHSVENI
jgi:hypothetical protein